MPEYLTRRELADALKVSPKTLRRLERDGLGPRPVRISPRIVRYPANAVAEYASSASPAEVHAVA